MKAGPGLLALSFAAVIFSLPTPVWSAENASGDPVKPAPKSSLPSPLKSGQCLAMGCRIKRDTACPQTTQGGVAVRPVICLCPSGQACITQSD